MGTNVTEGSKGASNLGINKGYQLRTVRVEKILLTSKQLKEKNLDWSSVGTIYYTGIKNTQSSMEVSKMYKARPLFPHMKYYPLIGEIVLILSLFSKEGALSGNNKKTTAYYLPNIKIFNNSNHNAVPKLYTEDANSTPNPSSYAFVQGGGVINKNDSKIVDPLGEYFTENNIKNLLPYEGDYIMEGRFGNSIRFGSTTPNNDEVSKNHWSYYSEGGVSKILEQEGKVGDPITIIRNGQSINISEGSSQPLLEDINGDDSSMYMCSNQRLSNLVVAGVKSASTESVEQQSYGAQVFDILVKSNPVMDFALDYIPTKEQVVATYDAAVEVVNVGLNVIDDILETNVIDDIAVPTTSVITTSDDSETIEDELSFYDEMVASGAAVVSDFDSYDFEYISEENSSQAYTDDTPEEEPGESSGESSGGPYGGPPYTGTPGDWDKNHLMYMSVPSEDTKRTEVDWAREKTNPSGKPDTRSKKLLDANGKKYTITYHYDIGISQVTGGRGLNGGDQGSTRAALYRSLGFKDDSIDPKGPFPPRNSRTGAPTYVPIAKDWHIMKKTAGPLNPKKIWLVLHYTAGSQNKPAYESTAGALYSWRNSKALGGSLGGYHWMVQADGKTTHIYNDMVTANGASGYNGEGIQINWMGGDEGKLNMTNGQANTLNTLVRFYCKRYPNIKVIGHNNVAKKGCPGFHVSTYLDHMDLSKHKPEQVDGYDKLKVGRNWVGKGGDYYDMYVERAGHVAAETPTNSPSKSIKTS